MEISLYNAALFGLGVLMGMLSMWAIYNGSGEEREGEDDDTDRDG